MGLLFAVLGLTGSALVFYTDIDAALHPVVEAGPGDAPPGLASPAWDRALATGRARWRAITVEMAAARSSNAQGLAAAGTGPSTR